MIILLVALLQILEQDRCSMVDNSLKIEAQKHLRDLELENWLYYELFTYQWRAHLGVPSRHI